MRYSFDIIVPKNTLAIHPYSTHLRLDYGMLTQAIIRFRAGCHHRVFVAIYDSLLQIAPAAGTTGLYADDLLITIPMSWPIHSPPFDLIFKAWSPGTFYDHTISIWLDLEEQLETKQSNIIDQFKRLLGI